MHRGSSEPQVRPTLSPASWLSLQPISTPVAIRHVPFEDLGLVGPILKQAGWSISYRDAPTVDLDDPLIGDADLLIVLGGPIGVYDVEAFPFLAREIDWLELRLKHDRATLGICLGSQLMAKALGSRVFAGPAKEIGWGHAPMLGAARACSPFQTPTLRSSTGMATRSISRAGR